MNTLKINCIDVLIIAAIFILYTYAQPDNPELLSCIVNLNNVFGICTSPLDCIKIAIRNIFKIQTLHPDVEGYYKSFSGKAISNDILEKETFCKNLTSDIPIPEKYMENAKCKRQLKIFGDTKDDILENAIYSHKCEGATWDSCYMHKKNSFGYNYLVHIASVITLKEDEYLYNQELFCYDKYYVKKVLEPIPEMPQPEFTPELKQQGAKPKSIFSIMKRNSPKKN